MVDVTTQYNTYPYPHRDPADERRRLITGSPSWPVEMDHYLFAGRRDWSQPLRVLVAGGGTGDGLIQLATLMRAARKPFEITYVDLSDTARAIAEARARERGLDHIAFHTGSLLDAPQMGEFDYIDCCGVLHHLPDPDAGFAALAAALAPKGGIGLMVYAPLGRSGVYPLQQAFGALFEGLSAADRLAQARRVLENLPRGHPFVTNPHLVDHENSDAGFYDLLLHSQDRPYALRDLVDALTRAGLGLSGLVPRALYDLERLLPEGGAGIPDTMDETARMAAAEQLRGTIKTHIAYAAPQARAARPAGPTPDAVPHLKGVEASKLAKQVARRGMVSVTLGVTRVSAALPPEAAPLLARINGRRCLSEISAQARLDPFRANALWQKLDHELGGWGLLHYSGLLL